MDEGQGSPPRPALEYIKALEKALSLEPEVLLPGHGDPLLGRENIRRKLTLFRDAVLKSLLAKSGNSIEANWLKSAIRAAEAKLKGI